MGQTRVLIVDDESSLRATVEAILDDEFHVEGAEGVREALAVLGAKEFDVVVTDYSMKDGTGATLFTLIQTRHPTISTIVLTGLTNDPEVRALQKSGSVLILWKPVVPTDLVNWVRNAGQMAALKRTTSALHERRKAQ